jgi:methyltransferase (TIGR00027 family)
MEQHKASMTAVVSAFARAYHAKNDSPLIFNDYLAFDMIGEEQYNQVATNMLNGYPFFAADEATQLQTDVDKLKWVVQTQLAPTPLARAHYCEDMLQNAMQLGCQQYVILGAGLDTYSFRHAEAADHLTIFELDHPATQAYKKQRLQEIGWELPDNLHFLPIDFTQQNLSDVLTNSQFNPMQRSFFNWLGVTYYLDKEAIERTLQEIAAISPQGSSILFDFPNEQLFTTPVKRVQSMVGMAKATGEPMKSCFSYPELESILEKCGFLIYEHLPTDEIQSRYFENRSDHLRAFDTVEYVLAVRNS